MAAALSAARTALTADQRRWLAAFELEARMAQDGSFDLSRVARQLGGDVEAARRALASVRDVLASFGLPFR